MALLKRVFLTAVTTAALLVPGIAQAANWSQFHGTADRIGVAVGESLLDRTIVAGLHITWITRTGASIEGVNSSPAVVQGVVYIGSDDKRMWALDETTGAPLWRFKTGGQVRSSPAVDAGMVFFGSGDGKVYALDATTGQKVWSYNTGGSISASPLVVNGTLYIGSRSGAFVA
ncbi:MAG: hypothetical protein QOI60_286, partial [Actinomycetota bacterium]|nr:hypothetical protein [Actinomycetota bacterium]